jgi:CO/xanthine dehydrogenase FAD-binding subunit
MEGVMAERDSDASGSSPARSGVSRRAFFRGAGVSAAGVALLDSGFGRAAEAVVRGGEQILTGKQVTEQLARDAARAAVVGATPLSKNAYKVPVLEAVVRRTILTAAAATS